MKLREYIENLNKLATEHPEYLDLDVIYASDDEGNYYNEVNYEPAPMFHDKETMFQKSSVIIRVVMRTTWQLQVKSHTT